MGETMSDRSEVARRIADELHTRHWDGTGCGTNGPSACSICYGPSPMTVHEVAAIAARVALDVLRG
jgi:hypothetical protein